VNFYKRYIGDYVRDTADLSLAEHGAYTLLLDHYYATESALPSERQSLYRICKAFTKAEQKAVDAVAARFFSPQADGRLANKRAVEELEKRSHQVAVNRAIGNRGGRPKKTDSVSIPITDSVSETEPINNPNHSQKELPIANAIGASPDPDPLFGNGLQILTTKGVSEKNARSFVGLMRKSVGDVVAFELLTLIEREDISDPIPWLRKAMGARGMKDDKPRVAL
jgi:uncharacterized protein YdaU (DUF1376 family)